MIKTDANHQTLRVGFCKAMTRIATKNQNQVQDLWEKITSDMQKRPFHNLESLERSINIVGQENILLPDNLTIALILQYAKFNPMNLFSKKESAEYAEYVLDECYGVESAHVRAISRIILSTSRLFSPSDLDSFDVRLAHDLKLVRLSIPWDKFLIQAKCIRKEFPQLSELKFAKYHLSLFEYLQNKEILYALKCLSSKFLASTKTNINKYISLLKNEIEELEKSA